MRHQQLQLRPGLRTSALGAALALGVMTAPTPALAQSAIIYGSVSNFDISNDTGKVCHGFEIDLDGQTTLLPDTAHFTAERYGVPTSSFYTGGVAVRWESPFDPATQTFTQSTVQHTVPWFPGQCYQWTVPDNYNASGCEHFGTARVGTTNITNVTARWLCEDPANPAALAPVDPPTAVPFPSYSVVPPAVVNNPPQVVMEVVAPEPAEAPELYGDAQWMRVFVTELPRQVALDELVADNPAVVPMADTQLESNWDVIQTEPVGINSKRSRKRNGRTLQPTTQSVIRRIEMYEYTGAYDPVTHQALCADGTCTAPAAGELGALISTQMSAVNVQEDSLTITKSGTGGGLVESTDKVLSCGSKCVSPYVAGTLVTLNAKANSGSTFAGWTGACSGTSSCTIPVSGHTDVGATFNTTTSTSGGGGGGTTTTSTASLSVKTSGGKGFISSTPAGISCGSTCSAKVVPGTAVTLSVLPDPGLHFVNWSGSCTGASATTTVTVSGSMTCQANLSK